MQNQSNSRISSIVTVAAKVVEVLELLGIVDIQADVVLTLMQFGQYDVHVDVIWLAVRVLRIISRRIK